MIKQCFETNTGIQFDADRLFEIGLDPGKLYSPVYSHARNAPQHSTTQIQMNIKKDSPEKMHDRRISSMAGTLVDSDVSLDGHDKTERYEKEIDNLHKETETDEHGNKEIDELHEEEKVDELHTEQIIDIDESHTGQKIDDSHEETVEVNAKIETNTTEEKGTTIAPANHAYENKEEQSWTTHEELLDVLSPIYDQLQIKKAWWALEYIPMRDHVLQADGTWKKQWTIHRGRPRVVPQEQPLKVHRSVKLRMDAQELKYKPRLQFLKEPTWVD